MRTKTYFAGVVISAVMILASCSDFLEEENRQALTNANAFKEPEIFGQLVNNVYGHLRNAVMFIDLDDYGTDIVTRNSPVYGMDELNDYVNLSVYNGSVWQHWYNYYNVVNAANLVTSRVDQIQGLSNEALTHGLAEAKFLRALAYFYLVENYGDIPLLLEEITTARTQFERAKEKAVYAQIVKDLDDALNGVTESAEVYGRITKDAVRHLKAKVLLTRGYKSYRESNDFATAQSLAEQVMANRTLSPDFESLIDIFNQRNSEVFFAVLFDSSSQAIGAGNFRHRFYKFDYEFYPGMERTNLFNKGHGNTLTPFYFSLFEAGDMRADASFRRVLYALKASEDETIQPGDTAIYFPEAAWSQDEKAGKAYVVVNPDEYFVNNGITNVHYPLFRKFDDPDVVYSNEGVDPKGRRDAFLFRSGETILIAAEAALQQGDKKGAAAHLTALRKRAGLIAPVSEDQVTIDFILDERARELAGEVSRWMDLKRTGKLIERVLAHNPHAALHNAIRPYHLVRPIPQSEIDLSSGSLKQNSGYNN
jgi:starch-binding outer membrane protein, SusD/RagB family